MDTFTNITYDPSRQGYDSSIWRTILGTPLVLGGQLAVQQASLVHLADSTRGNYIFNVNIPNSPVGGESRRLGLYSPNSGAYAWFSIESEALTAQCSDGYAGNTSTGTIAWESAWSGVNTEFRIHWDAGKVEFYVAGIRKATLSGNSIPKEPLAVYLSNLNSDYMTVQYVRWNGVQAFYMHMDLADTIPGPGPDYSVDTITITESITRALTMLLGLQSDSLSISESTTQSLTLLPTALSDAISITENVAQTQVFTISTVADAISIAENVAQTKVFTVSVSDSMTIGENVAAV